MRNFKKAFRRNSRANSITQIRNFESDWIDTFSSAVKDAEEELRVRIFNLQQESNALGKELDFYPNEEILVNFAKIDNIIGTIVDYDSKMITAKEHLTVLAEMKIIYIFKSLETKIKSLLYTAYPQIKISDLYRWDSIVSVFKGYKEVLELQKVNNNLKHSELLND